MSHATEKNKDKDKLASSLVQSMYRYGKQINTHDLFKIVASTLMVVDHYGELILSDNPWCRLLGRAAAPLFFFLVGFTNKLHINRSLISYGLILTFIYSFFHTQFFINILINFIIIHYCLLLLPLQNWALVPRLISFGLLFGINIVIYPFIEYGTLGMLIAYSGRMLAIKDRYTAWFLLFSLGIYFTWQAKIFHFLQALPYSILLGGLALCSYFAMLYYRQRTFIFPKPITIVGLIISRYSLPIYFYHYLLLQIINLAQHTPSLFIVR